MTATVMMMALARLEGRVEALAQEATMAEEETPRAMETEMTVWMARPGPVLAMEMIKMATMSKMETKSKPTQGLKLWLHFKANPDNGHQGSVHAGNGPQIWNSKAEPSKCNEKDGPLL